MNNKIGFISGTGPQGKGVALRLAQAGVKVVIGSRTIEKAKTTADEINKLVGKNLAMGLDNSKMIKDCDIIFLTVPFEHALETIETYLPELQVKSEGIFVDVTVPLTFNQGKCSVCTLEEESGIELLRTKVPNQLAMVGAFKTISAEWLNDLTKPLDLTDFIFGDNEAAVNTIVDICYKIPGLQPIRAGDLCTCNVVERMTAFLINLNKLHKVKHLGFRLQW